MRCRRPFTPRARRICLLLMDVDGVLTDGRISFIEGAAEAKTYDVKDGIGLSIARRMGLRTGVISGRGGAAVVRRVEELGLHEVHLRVRNKLQAYDRIVRRLNDGRVPRTRGSARRPEARAPSFEARRSAPRTSG